MAVAPLETILARPSLVGLLAPVTEDAFFARYWQEEPLVVSGRAPDYYRNVLSFAEVDHLIALAGKEGDEVTFVKGYEPRYFNFRRANIPFPQQAYDAYAAGYTIVLNDLVHSHPPIASLARELERRFNCPVRANAYVTPADARGFEAHYDGHDVLVFQVHGSKRWTVYSNVVEALPRKGSPVWKEHLAGHDPLFEVVLEGGDLMYLPRGFVHLADTVERGTSSLHLTMGVQSVTWADFLAHAVRARSRRNVALRRSLPVGFLNEGCVLANAEREFRNVLDLFVREADFREALALFTKEFIVDRAAVPDGHFRNLDAMAALDQNTSLARREGALSRVTAETDGTHIEFSSGSVRGSRKMEAALRFVNQSPPFRVHEIPGLGEAERLLFARSLIKEGFLRVV